MKADSETLSGDQTITRTDFADRWSITRQRVFQYIKRGLPLADDGNIDLARADQWMRDNVDRQRRQGTRAEAGSWRDAKDKADAQLKQLELRRREGELVERHEAEKAIYERAQAERHAWTGWVASAASAMASELGVDEGQAFAVLDRLVRDHLERLSEESLEVLHDRNGA